MNKACVSEQVLLGIGAKRVICLADYRGGKSRSLGITGQITPGIRSREAEARLFCLAQPDKALDVRRTCKCATLSSVLSAAGTTNLLTD